MESLFNIVRYLREFNFVSIIFRLCLPILIGGLVGFERSKSGRAAGLRTHILVCLGASVASMIGLYINLVYGEEGDISRIAAQVVSGIGFLGAGTILVKNHETVTGLTTAACVWAVGILGLSIGYGFYEAAIIGAALISIIIHLLGSIDRKIRRNMRPVSLYVEIIDVKFLTKTTAAIEGCGCEIINACPVAAKSDSSTGVIGIELLVQISRTANDKVLIDKINMLDNVLFAMNTYA